jgi:hypothetical protein
MSKALLSSKKKINAWLSMELNDRPLEKTDANQTRLVGKLSLRPSGTVRELLESLINQNEWSVHIERSLTGLSYYFNLKPDWWKDREGLGTWLLNPIAAAFADAWIYSSWLHQKSPEAANRFADFFAASIMHPEWISAVDAMWLEHYPSVGGNLFDVIPRPKALMYPEDQKKSPWYPKYRQKIGKELIQRSVSAHAWLRDVFTSSPEDKATKLEDGLNHISFAALKSDSTFFIGLGKALSETFEPMKRLTLEEIQNQPTSKSRKGITNRQWCRRLWISRATKVPDTK